MRFTLQQIQCFVVAAKHEFFSDAAQELRMSPSAFSDQISNLEKIVGEQLFTRTNRGAKITPRGNDLLADAKDLIDKSVQFELSLQTQKDFLRLATMISIPEISYIMREMNKAFPKADITTERLPYLEAIPSLETKQIDGLFIALPSLKIPPSTHYIPLQEQELVAAVPEQHALSDRENTNLQELAEQEILCVTDMEQDLWCQKIFGEEQVKHVRRKPLIIEELQAQDLVAAGFGINICPESLQTTTPREEIRYIPIDDAPKLSVGLMTMADDQRPIVKELRKIAEQVTKKNARQKSHF